ncbi:PREDICTED: olfactory receptor 2A2-like [Elephantulus edwardii]|uniref:olfactory receptor 2A2-like n=1 Tax=Elephantulus edwardii TaxID=28737 RepID=UPI0003F0C360|nr:PREDICTED: olfactory receptor 2A2-like [Elephantulus edwardii]
MRGNQSWVTEFILVGFQLSADVEFLLFWVFFMFYVFSLLANGVIFGLICLDPRLHTPMYFFLSHLAVLDIAYASNHVPKMLANLVNQEKTISFVSCVIQVFLYLALAATECLILVVMSYDRYVAICHPLHYMVIMSWRVCTAMASMSWACGFTLAIVHATLLQRLPFCGPQEVNHLFCEILSVLKLACADTSVNQVVILAASFLVLVGPLFFMLISYTRILWAILKIQSREGRRKAFATCSSHLCVVGLFFGIAMLVYMVPDSKQREEQEKMLSLFHSLFNPMLNPLIYSLRNVQVKEAFYRALQRKGAV